MTAEKKICCGIMICEMLAILSGVAILYLAAIVVMPSKNELKMGFHTTPVMCTTVHAVDKAKLPKHLRDCDWSTCGEWCLSKGSGVCMQIRVMVRHNGSTVQFNDCQNTQDESCSALDPNLGQKFKCKKSECHDLFGLYNCSKYDTNDCVEITSAYSCHKAKISSEVIDCTEEKCSKRLDGVYWCKEGKCQHLENVKKYQRDCERKCTNLHLRNRNVVIFSNERVAITSCASLNTTSNNTVEEVSDMQDWQEGRKVFTVFCTFLRKGKGSDNNIYGEDCFNGTLGNAADTQNIDSYLQLLDYQDQLNEEHYNNDKWVINYERSLSFMNDTKLYINTEGCVNTLQKECKAFFKTHAHDGSDGITPDRFTCFYTDQFNDFVVGVYKPEFTQLLLILALAVPGSSFVFSCCCLYFCSKAIGVGDDGHLKLVILNSDDKEGKIQLLLLFQISQIPTYSYHT